MSTDSSEAVSRTPIAEIFSGRSAGSESAEQPKGEAPKDVKSAQAPAESSSAQAPKEEPKSEPKAEAPKAETEAKSERTRDDKGRFKSEADEAIAGAQSALVAERRKRQELERRLQELESKKPKRDFFEDPEAALNERDAQLRAENDERFFGMCEEAAREHHTDYDDLVAKLMEDAQSDPALANRTYAGMRQARNPAEFLYRTAKVHVELKAVGGDLGKYREGVEKPLKAELEARDAKIKELETQLANLGKVPSSLNSEPSSTRASVAAEESKPTPIDDVFKPRKRRQASG